MYMAQTTMSIYLKIYKTLEQALFLSTLSSPLNGCVQLIFFSWGCRAVLSRGNRFSVHHQFSCSHAQVYSYTSNITPPPGPSLITLGTRPLYKAKIPSSRQIISIVLKQLRYLISPGTGWGPWIRLFATSKGMLNTEPIVPETKPIPNFLKNSKVGSLLDGIIFLTLWQKPK